MFFYCNLKKHGNKLFKVTLVEAAKKKTGLLFITLVILKNFTFLIFEILENVSTFYLVKAHFCL